MQNMQTKSGGGGGGLWPTCPPCSYHPATYRGKRGTVKEWKGVIEKIRGSILLFCREKRGRQEEGSVIRTPCSDKKLSSTLFNGHAVSHQKQE